MAYRPAVYISSCSRCQLSLEICRKRATISLGELTNEKETARNVNLGRMNEWHTEKFILSILNDRVCNDRIQCPNGCGKGNHFLVAHIGADMVETDLNNLNNLSFLQDISWY